MTDRELAASAQAMLGECIMLMREAAQALTEEEYMYLPTALTDLADRASAIRWEGINPKEDGE